MCGADRGGASKDQGRRGGLEGGVRQEGACSPASCLPALMPPQVLVGRSPSPSPRKENTWLLAGVHRCLSGKLHGRGCSVPPAQVLGLRAHRVGEVPCA